MARRVAQFLDSVAHRRCEHLQAQTSQAVAVNSLGRRETQEKFPRGAGSL